MCLNSGDRAALRRRQSKKHNPRVIWLNRRRRRRSRGLSKEEEKKKSFMVVGGKSEMEMKNLKLYIENQSILEENHKLRQRVLLLHQENAALLLQLHNNFSSLPIQQSEGNSIQLLHATM